MDKPNQQPKVLTKEERFLRIVSEGMDSEYYGILSGEIKELIGREERVLQGFKVKGLSRDIDRDAFNFCVVRIETLGRVLQLNDALLKRFTPAKSWGSSAKDFAINAIGSFVGKGFGKQP